MPIKRCAFTHAGSLWCYKTCTVCSGLCDLFQVVSKWSRYKQTLVLKSQLNFISFSTTSVHTTLLQKEGTRYSPVSSDEVIMSLLFVWRGVLNKKLGKSHVSFCIVLIFWRWLHAALYETGIICAPLHYKSRHTTIQWENRYMAVTDSSSLLKAMQSTWECMVLWLRLHMLLPHKVTLTLGKRQ